MSSDNNTAPNQTPDDHTYILVVEDEPNVARLIRLILERQDFLVETARNGVEALAQIEKSLPDLVITDVMMPEMDGFELVTRIRSDPALAGLRIIILTVKAQDADVKRGYSAGADIYLTKPFDPSELVDVVNRVRR